MIILKNVSRRAKVFNLPHDIVCNDVPGQRGCRCVMTEHRQREHNPATGEVGVRHIDRQISDSVHLMPGCSSEPMPESVTAVPEIRAALASGEIVAE